MRMAAERPTTGGLSPMLYSEADGEQRLLAQGERYRPRRMTNVCDSITEGKYEQIARATKST